jgi:hypothetical protein
VVRAPHRHREDVHGAGAGRALALIAFERLQHLVVVPAAVGGIETRLVLDTGIGLTVLSESLGARAGCEPTGASFEGKRMSGQSVSVPLAHARSLALGGLERHEVEVGLLDMSGFPRELAGIDGFVGLDFLAEVPFTVDYAAGRVVLESDESLAERRRAGIPVGVSIEREGPAVDVFCALTIPGGRAIAVEVDMGSDALILDERFAAETGVDLGADGVRRVDGTDETGHAYTRWFTKLSGEIHPPSAPELAQHAPDVQFQCIIHDGLVGDAFLRRFAVTYDVAGAELIFGVSLA